MDYRPDALSGRRLQVLDNAIKSRRRQVECLFLSAPSASAEESSGSELDRRHANGLLWDVVFLIGRQDLAGAPLGVTDLYLHLGVSKGTALRTLDRLLALGCIEKTRDRQDSRRTKLRLTPGFRDSFEGLLDEMIEDARNL